MRASSLQTLWSSRRKNRYYRVWICFYLLILWSSRKSCICTKSPCRCQHQWCRRNTKSKSIRWYRKSTSIWWCCGSKNNYLRECRNLRLPRSSQTRHHQILPRIWRDSDQWSSCRFIHQSTLLWSSRDQSIWSSRRKNKCQTSRNYNRSQTFWRGRGTTHPGVCWIRNAQASQRYDYWYPYPHHWYWIYQGQKSDRI